MLLVRAGAAGPHGTSQQHQRLQQQQNPEAHAKGTLSLRVLYRYVNSFGPGYAIPILLVVYLFTQVGEERAGCSRLAKPCAVACS